MRSKKRKEKVQVPPKPKAGVKYDSDKLLFSDVDTRFLLAVGCAFRARAVSKEKGKFLNALHDYKESHSAIEKLGALAEMAVCSYEADKAQGFIPDREEAYAHVPSDFVEGYVDIMTRGAKKYARNNWKDVDEGEDRFLAAAMRHFWKIASKHLRDDEWNTPHKDHAACSTAFCAEHARKKEKAAK